MSLQSSGPRSPNNHAALPLAVNPTVQGHVQPAMQRTPDTVNVFDKSQSAKA